MARSAAGLAIAAAALLQFGLGCGADESRQDGQEGVDPSTTAKRPDREPETPAGPVAEDFSDEKVGGFRMSPRARFEVDKAACASFPRESLARQVKAPPSASPQQIAAAYRRSLFLEAPDEVLEAVEEGCLAGILTR